MKISVSTIHKEA